MKNGSTLASSGKRLEMSRKAQILRIEKISPHDGAGLRTVIFFKGCPLRCAWCSTPESQEMEREIYYQSERCVLCAECIKTCTEKAISIDILNKVLQIDKKKCMSCYKCVDVCTKNALGIYGKQMTVTEVMKEILKDEIFYYHSGGGVTLSGGDVLQQADFAKELLRECKDAGIHTMAELDMFGSYEHIKKLLPDLDAFYVDLKVMDHVQHKKWTGVDNTVILENVKKAAQECRRGALHVRVPLVFHVNDSFENIKETAEFCEKLNDCQELEFLPYHRLGRNTYKCLGRNYLFSDMPVMIWQEAWERVSCLKEKKYPFPIKIAGKVI